MTDESAVQLKFGVLCKSFLWRDWETRCIQELLNSGIARLEVVMLTEDCDYNEPSVMSAGLSRPSLTFRVFRKYLSGFRAFNEAPVGEMLAGTPTIRFTAAKQERGNSHSNEDQLDVVRKMNLDFIWGIDLARMPDGLPRTSKYGVWFFRHDCREKCGHGVPFFNEMVGGEHTVRIVMDGISGQSDKPVPLREGRLKIVKHSYKETINSIYGQCAKWPLWICKSIRAGGARTTPRTPPSTEFYRSETPSSLDLLLLIIRLAGRLLADKYRSLFRHFQWNIGIMEIPISRLLQGEKLPNVRYLDINWSKTKFMADPFALGNMNTLTILCEEFDYGCGKGIIRWMKLREGNRLTDSQVLFDKPHHMSYPYLFAHEGEIYCVPEAARGRRMTLYKAAKFPEVWTPACDLVRDTAAVDSTVFRYQNRWWVAFTDLDHDPNLNLFLWYSDELQGPWFPHACNPVKTDIGSARPAGTPFMHDGNLYRPSQDSCKSYGARTIINRITKLTPREFEEEPAVIVEPQRDGDFPAGLHTLCSVGDITVIDSCRVIFVGAEFRRVLRERIRKTCAALRRSVSRSHC